MARYLSTLIFLITIGALTQQVRGAPEQVVSINFRVYGIGNDEFSDLYAFNGGNYHLLSFKRTSRSAQTYEYKGTPNFSIYTINPEYQSGTTGTAKFIELSRLHLSENLSSSLVVFAADSNNRNVPSHQRRYNLFIIDESPESFPRDSIIFLNITGTTLYGKIGSEQLRLPLGHSQAIDYANFSGKENGLPISFAVQSNRGPRLVMSNNVRLAANRRCILILQPPKRENSTRIEMRMLSQAVYESPQEDL